MTEYRFIDSDLHKVIENIAIKHNIEDNAIPIIYQRINWIIAYVQHIQYADGSLDEMFKILYAIKASKTDKKISLRGVASDDARILDASSNSKISIDLTNPRTRILLANTLEQSISNETKDYYINRFVVEEYQSEEERRINEQSHKLYLRHRDGKIPFEEYKAESIKLHNSYVFPSDYRYTNFFSLQNLHKIIAYNQKFENNDKLYKGQLTGRLARELLAHFSEKIFGIEYKWECLKGADKILDPKTNEVVAECEPQDVWVQTGEELRCRWTKYTRYLLVYDLLFAIGVIKSRKATDNDADICPNNEKYRAIKDAIKAYKDISDTHNSR